MQRLSNGTQVASLPTPIVISGTPGFATAGNPETPLPASEWDADQYNRIQEEIIAPILAAGIALDPSNNAQLLAAIQQIAAAALGFTPVQQGGGLDQTAGHKLYFGYDATAGLPRIQIDTNDQGTMPTIAWLVNQFLGSFGTSGYQFMVGGFMIQWGVANLPQDGIKRVYGFPTAFPHICLQIVGNYGASVPPNDGNCGFEPTTNATFSATDTASGGSGVTNGISFIAVGY